MKAVILAAGKGTRLNGMASSRPKCLEQVGGISLIERQVRALKAEGIDEIISVVGFGAEQVRQTCGPRIGYIENRHYAETNSLFSLWLARHFLIGGFIVLNADVLFHPQLLRDLLATQYEDALLVSYPDESTPPLGEEEMKVKLRAGRVIDISKKINCRKADGENVGIAKFGPSGARLMVEKMDSLIRLGAHNDWAPRAFREFLGERPLYAVGTRGYPWIEIDFPQDYRRAVDEVLPRILEYNEMGASLEVSIERAIA